MDDDSYKTTFAKVLVGEREAGVFQLSEQRSVAHSAGKSWNVNVDKLRLLRAITPVRWEPC